MAISTGDLDCSLGGFSCRAIFRRGTPVTVTATPLKGFAFSGFSGDCSGPAR